MNAPNQNRKRVRRTTSLLGRPLSNKSSVESTDAGAQTARVSGPYLDTNTQTYRVIVFDGGKRKSMGSLQSMDEALAVKAELERSIQSENSISIRTAIIEFLKDKEKQGLKPRSLRVVSYKLFYFLPLDKSVSSFTADNAQQLYEAETVKISRFGRVTRSNAPKIAGNGQDVFSLGRRA